MTLDVVEAIYARRSVKAYDPDFVMRAEDEAKLFALVRQAPTSFNTQNTRFVVVRDKALRARLQVAAWNQTHVGEASLALVICADLKAYARDPARYWQDAPAETRDAIVPKLVQFYQGREQVQRDEAMRSAGIAAQTLMLAAKAMGYDSCPLIGFDPELVAELINLPADHVVCMMVVIGKAARPPRQKGGFLPDSEVFIENRFPG
jgi:nitroreductase